jgi:starch synthase
VFLMPSRFEPCGLTQMYSLQYGTIPVAARTGGLNDTIVHADGEALAQGRATGFLFRPGSAEAMLDALGQAVGSFHNGRWALMMQAGMEQDFSWERSAHRYRTLYEQALADRAEQRQESSW